VPLVSIALTTGIALLLALIILGSALAFNDVLSLTVSSLYLSYLIGNSLLLWRRLRGSIGEYNPTNASLIYVARLGYPRLTWGIWRIAEPWGTVVNVVGCLYMVVILFFSFWPTTMHPGVAGMNYSSLMLGAVVFMASGYYVVSVKRTYKGPVIEVN
jgi:choline transport protein